MRNVKKMVFVFTCLALLGAMQVMAVTYSPKKGPSYGQSRVEGSAVAPSTSFQSTSPMYTKDEVSTSPALREDGTVNEEAYGVGRSGVHGGVRRAGGTASPGEEGSGTGNLNNESENDETQNGSPIGDAVLPLMMLLCAYAGYKVLARIRA